MTRKKLDKIIEELKMEYPIGTEVELVKMEDEFTHIPPGTKGIVRNIDSLATIHVNWESGSSLGVVYNEDKIRKL